MSEENPTKQLLSGQTILVTGAGDGIGKTMSIALAAQGATIILLGRTTAKLEAVYDIIEAAGSPQAAIYPLNLEGASPHDYFELAETVAKEFGSLEGLLHNAAQVKLLSRLDDYDVDTWYQVMQVNLNAPFMLTQACLPILRSAEQASVVFTSDTIGRKAKAYWGAYGVSKFGVEGLMQLLAEETRENSPIRVNSVDPGPTRSNLRAHAYPGEDPLSIKTAEELIPLYLWLFGAESIGITGQAFSFDNWPHTS